MDLVFATMVKITCKKQGENKNRNLLKRAAWMTHRGPFPVRIRKSNLFLVSGNIFGISKFYELFTVAARTHCVASFLRACNARRNNNKLNNAFLSDA